MEPTQQNTTHPVWNNKEISQASTKVTTKAIIVFVLTICMLIPTAFISNLIIERQQNNKPTIEANAHENIAKKELLNANYEKIMRTTKYAILVIGLTFTVFFLIELMHNKPVHPVQYTLVGFALAIFYLLLLSISEYWLFNYAYSIASTATIVLITFYVKNHFNNWKASFCLGGLLTVLYTFILVLVGLEKFALLVGSIALFAILTVVMYATRNFNWYKLEFSHAKNIVGSQESLKV